MTSALLAWAAATRAPGLRVPPAVAVLAAGVAGLAAWRLGQLYRGRAGAGDDLATLLLTGMAALALWIAAGPGPRSCGVGGGGRPLAGASGLACRLPFGVGGLLLALTALYALRRWVRARRAATRRAP